MAILYYLQFICFDISAPVGVVFSPNLKEHKSKTLEKLPGFISLNLFSRFLLLVWESFDEIFLLLVGGAKRNVNVDKNNLKPSGEVCVVTARLRRQIELQKEMQEIKMKLIYELNRRSFIVVFVWLYCVVAFRVIYFIFVMRACSLNLSN